MSHVFDPINNVHKGDIKTSQDCPQTDQNNSSTDSDVVSDKSRDAAELKIQQEQKRKLESGIRQIKSHRIYQESTYDEIVRSVAHRANCPEPCIIPDGKNPSLFHIITFEANFDTTKFNPPKVVSRELSTNHGCFSIRGNYDNGDNGEIISFPRTNFYLDFLLNDFTRDEEDKEKARKVEFDKKQKTEALVKAMTDSVTLRHDYSSENNFKTVAEKLLYTGDHIIVTNPERAEGNTSTSFILYTKVQGRAEPLRANITIEPCKENQDRQYQYHVYQHKMDVKPLKLQYCFKFAREIRGDDFDKLLDEYRLTLLQQGLISVAPQKTHNSIDDLYRSGGRQAIVEAIAQKEAEFHKLRAELHELRTTLAKYDRDLDRYNDNVYARTLLLSQREAQREGPRVAQLEGIPNASATSDVSTSDVSPGDASTSNTSACYEAAGPGNGPGSGPGPGPSVGPSAEEVWIAAVRAREDHFPRYSANPTWY